ncbi:MAG TPA: sodium ion-translocating decarboxylase subunit beta, partial [Bacteroidales bacterium]|nr:sodium ion-translocating decarboxylase subunit beta [Bacteroidales bacterium]HRW25945.1 sodium ion-translocating decarboxylase subunit beta [Bacteroidales bacterium]
MTKRKTWTMLALLVITSLAWLAFVKPEHDRQKAQAESGIEISAALPQYQPDNQPEEGFVEGLKQFWAFTGFRNVTSGHLIMILVGLIFIFLAIRYEYEPLLLIPIGTGILIGNIPLFTDGGMNLQVGIYQQGSVLNYLYFGVLKGVYPPLI